MLTCKMFPGLIITCKCLGRKHIRRKPCGAWHFVQEGRYQLGLERHFCWIICEKFGTLGRESDDELALKGIP